MWQRFRSEHDAERGVTLLEFLIYITLVVTILVGSAQLLFSMRKSTGRMEFETDARQTARQAVEYIGRYVRGATDMNNVMGANNPYAIVVWAQRGASAVQTSYNNVSDAALADVGTDILTLVYPVNNASAESVTWPGWSDGALSVWRFREGCPDDAQNLALFKSLTGAHSEGGNEISRPMIIVDSLGNEGWFQITTYVQSDCSAGTVSVRSNTTIADNLTPPGGQPNFSPPIHLMLGTRFVAFRVRNGWLEQKDGIFDPSKDNPDSNPAPSPWSRVLPNVEDLQIAWVFNDGSIWNTSPSHRLSHTGSVPQQNPPGGGAMPTYDARNIVGIRVTVTAISSGDIPGERSARFVRPKAEDHPAGSAGSKDKRFHRRMSHFVMIRNRNLGQ